MPTMKSVRAAAPGAIEVAEVERPVPGPRDVLVRVRACGIIGCGGAYGGIAEYLLIENAAAGKSVAVFPGSLPFDVAALNEPMAVARHCVNRSGARTADKVVVFGAGPIGLGAPRPDTDIYIDAAGAAAVVNTVLRAAKWGARLISHRVPFADVQRAFQLALTPGAAEKVVVTFND